VEDVSTMFEMGKGKPRIRRGGKGNSIGDIGRYVEPMKHNPSVNDPEASPIKVVFVKIAPKAYNKAREEKKRVLVNNLMRTLKQNV
jgi:hypothetical protein